MAIANGVSKQLRYKKESTWGTAAGASGAQDLRRVTSDLSLNKETYQSEEIRSDQQVADFRHGVRSVDGSINGELSPGTYKDFMAAVLRRDFAAVTAMTGLSITISGSGPTYTVARGSGSFLTDGVKVGDVVRLTAGSFAAPNLNKNLLVTAVVALSLTVVVVNGSTMTAEGPISSATVTVPGKKTYTPATGHTNDSFSVEHWYSDINQSELFLGCKPSTMDIDLPPTGMATVAFAFMGKDITKNTSAYFTSPTAATTSGVMAAVNGIAFAGGSQLTLLTGLTINVNGNLTAEPVVGSNTYPDIFRGRVVATGEMTAFFENGTLRDAFLDETETSIFFVFTASNAAAADFVAFCLPRVKLGGAAKDDGEKGLVQTIPYTALLNVTGGAGTSGEYSTLVVQDSQA